MNLKIKAAIKAGLKPILCVGENLQEYESNETEKVVTCQVEQSLREVPLTNSMVVAYEPIWAIGTGKAANGEQANNVIALIRKIVAGIIGPAIAAEIRILYGGSVTADNIKEYVGQSDIDGGLVGGASLKADQFISIVKQTAAVRKI